LAKLFNLIYYLILTPTQTLTPQPVSAQLSPNSNHKVVSGGTVPIPFQNPRRSRSDLQTLFQNHWGLGLYRVFIFDNAFSMFSWFSG